MKITRVQVDGILGIQSIDLRLNKAVTLIAGRNGSGKSSLQESIRMAICQDSVRDITTKKEFGALVYAGAKAGGAQVTIDNDLENTFAFNMPKGDFTGPEISEPMRVALHGQRFANMTADQKRTFLFGLTKLKPNAETVKARMLAPKWACEEAKVDAVLPLLRTGFPSVCAHAKEKATEAKGAWRQLTGETYGSVKAEAWKAVQPDAPEGDAAALSEQVASLDKMIAKQNEALGTIKAAARTVADAVAKRAQLADAPAKLASIRKQLARAKDELEKYEPTVVALRMRAGGKARVGLVHDMAMFIATADIRSLGSEQEEDALALVKRYEKEHGKLEDAATIDTAAQAALPEHEAGLVVLQNRVKNLQRDLDSATQQKGQFDALAPAGEAVDASAEIAEVEQMIASAKADRAAAENKRLDLEAGKRKLAEAAGKTKAARDSHTSVLAWTKVADALAPDGIPAEMLADALAPVNAALAQAALDTDWMQVVIGADMAITAAGRPYQLLSESEQWRVDAMVAQVVAEISGLKILMLDRVDVLDLPGRKQLFDWMDVLAHEGIIDTALLFATLKALPESLADTVEAYWVEGGTIAGARQQAAA